jgi:hypothetical protein
MPKINKVQHLLISQLREKGHIELLLPGNMTLQIGITQEDKEGKKIKTDNYCYVVVSRDRTTALLDSYNLGLEYEDDPNTMIYQDKVIGLDGESICRLDVVT